ncbi:hypothetical protein MSG28_010919 [Choristoneura fumiferana]|uniref:Uncharacterized protein n=1 Tax=Choristoneura fumiferana TaxID=7141 RepID=A0ACC0KPK1_CHOFU|nr:hypothetical protein MSG28_010919 [Choristoneura fumiferana]
MSGTAKIRWPLERPDDTIDFPKRVLGHAAVAADVGRGEPTHRQRKALFFKREPSGDVSSPLAVATIPPSLCCPLSPSCDGDSDGQFYKNKLKRCWKNYNDYKLILWMWMLNDVSVVWAVTELSHSGYYIHASLHFVAVIFVGIPVVYSEICLAQYTNCDVISMWDFFPLFRPIGYGTIYLVILKTIFMIVLTTWYMVYTVHSALDPPPWFSLIAFSGIKTMSYYHGEEENVIELGDNYFFAPFASITEIISMIFQVIFFYIKRHLKELIKPTNDWGPNDNVLFKSRKMFVPEIMTREFLYRQVKIHGYCRNKKKTVVKEDFSANHESKENFHVKEWSALTSN